MVCFFFFCFCVFFFFFKQKTAYEIVDCDWSSDVCSSDLETLANGQQWRETTAAVMGTRSVPDLQGIDQSKMVPLLVAALQDALARITALENA